MTTPTLDDDERESRYDRTSKLEQQLALHRLLDKPLPRWLADALRGEDIDIDGCKVESPPPEAPKNIVERAITLVRPDSPAAKVIVTAAAVLDAGRDVIKRGLDYFRKRGWS
jgi:hypothetical protein